MHSRFVNNSFTKSLSRLITYIILPCFIFSQIINSFHINQYILIFKAFIGCFLNYLIGFIFGFISGKIQGYNSTKCKFIGATFSSPHSTSIPVILFSIIGPVLDSIIPIPAESTVDAKGRGFLYIVLNSIFSNIWRWSGIYYLVQPEFKEEEKIKFTQVFENKNSDGYAQLQDTSAQIPIKIEESMTCMKFIKEIMTVPVIASLATLSITLFPLFQLLFTTPGTLLNSSILSVCLMVSKSYAFLVMMLLGLSLSDAITTDPNEISKVIFKGWELMFICICKLVIMPIVSAPLFVYIYKYYLKTDDVMLFIYLLLSSSPSAINMIIICTIKGVYSESISMLMVAMYGIGIITLTLTSTAFIYLIGQLNGVSI